MDECAHTRQDQLRRSQRGLATCAPSHGPQGSSYSFGLSSPGEQEKIAVRIPNDECACPPRLGTKRLDELNACRLVCEKERLGVFERDRGRKQLLGVAAGGIDEWRVDTTKVQSRAV